jgi:hypothetical protein
MDNADPFNFLDLEDDHIPTGKNVSKYAREKFTCEGCNGTGLWAGGTNRHGNHKCNTCHGAGFLVTSAATRTKNRAAARTTKQNKAAANQTDNVVALGGEPRAEMLRGAGGWSSFADSLYSAHREGKLLSEKQLVAANGMLDKLVAREAVKAQAKVDAVANAPKVDLQAIRDMFETAFNNGHKRPKYRAEGLVINRAPDHGSNPGALYVKGEATGDYMGKVVGTKFMASRDAGPAVQELLNQISVNPLEAALRYGAKTGNCACCGRPLTATASVELGIGPICKARWGL